MNFGVYFFVYFFVYVLIGDGIFDFYGIMVNVGIFYFGYVGFVVYFVIIGICLVREIVFDC